MIKNNLTSSLVMLLFFNYSALAGQSEKIAKVSPQSIAILGHTVIQKPETGCPKQPATTKNLAQYLKQYDVAVEKNFYSTSYKYSPVDPSDGYPSGDLDKNWKTKAKKEVVEAGFGEAYRQGEEINPIKWMNFTGDGFCDFSAFQSLVGIRASVGRWFLFHELKNRNYQLVMSDAGDQGGAYSQAFSQITINGEIYPIVIFISSKNEYFQWNPDIQGFNKCPPNTYPDKPDAFKIYTKTSIAPKDSFLGKLCASPDAQEKLDSFLETYKSAQ